MLQLMRAARAQQYNFLLNRNFLFARGYFTTCHKCRGTYYGSTLVITDIFFRRQLLKVYEKNHRCLANTALGKMGFPTLAGSKKRYLAVLAKEHFMFSNKQLCAVCSQKHGPIGPQRTATKMTVFCGIKRVMDTLCCLCH